MITKKSHMKTKKITVAFLLLVSLFAACKKDDPAVELAKPTIENVEIGTANNKRAIRGRDFHFNADVLAATKIKEVQLKILQKTTENYTSSWKFELSWPEYVGVKNTNVHKHFTIPFIVTDENGTKLELKEDFSIVDAANMAVDPKIGRDFVSRNGELIYYTDTYVEKELIFKKGDELSLHAQIADTRGDGVLYSILVKRKSNYFPESIDKLDFNKAIVVTKVEHQGLGAASKVSTLKLKNGVYGGETITIGATADGNEPTANAIAGEKAWESGQYNWIILYKNTTYNMSIFKSIPIAIDYK
jgi:hypothetical protein